jgi:siderophore synthetase component
MLAALWRESPIPQLKPGQRVLTMAALLHIDAHGAALLPALINASGLSTANWLRHYLDCYLSPLLHCFYTYDLVFMPHGENLMLVLENSVPVRAIMKDIAEEVAIMNKDIILSEKVQRLSVFVPEELKTLSILTDVFDLIFRYISAILLEYQDYSESEFWQLVADCVLEYQRNHPHLADKFKKYDLFAPEFIRSCLNRLQLGNNQQMIDLADPAKNLKFVGTLKNPIAIFNTPIKTGRAEMTAV